MHAALPVLLLLHESGHGVAPETRASLTYAQARLRTHTLPGLS